ncbi:MAG: peptidylprolyl isomerase [Firmicutes bacterium]|nr:peptidylprolyl isomerase [Bacillota bacterium]
MQNTLKAEIILTDGRRMSVDLYPDIAPLSVENFVSLAKEGFYDGLCFHRVIPNFMVQGGGFLAKGGKLAEKKSAKSIKGEFLSNGVQNPLRHEKGVISMARTSVKDSATSQFFICVAAVPYLDGEYAAFGKASDAQSIAVAEQISRVPTKRWQHYDDVPVDAIEIQTIKII